MFKMSEIRQTQVDDKSSKREGLNKKARLKENLKPGLRRYKNL